MITADRIVLVVTEMITHLGLKRCFQYPLGQLAAIVSSWCAGVSRPLLILAVFAGAALLVTAAIALPRQIGETDEAAHGGWWLDYAEHATVLGTGPVCSPRVVGLAAAS